MAQDQNICVHLGSDLASLEQWCCRRPLPLGVGNIKSPHVRLKPCNAHSCLGQGSFIVKAITVIKVLRQEDERATHDLELALEILDYGTDVHWDRAIDYKMVNTINPLPTNQTQLWFPTTSNKHPNSARLNSILLWFSKMHHLSPA